ncbi:hypothetical protein PHLGIDRAFT_54932, partial [Phlebiopsis gigantea 11061_1 CR5-6]
YRKPKYLFMAFLRSVMESGSLTALIASLDIILFFTYPHEAYHACITLVLSKLYSNSLLVMFNSQIRLVSARSLEPDNNTSCSVGSTSYQ